MIEGRYRDIYQRLFITPILPKLARISTPIQLTILSGFLGLLVIPSLISGAVFLAIFFLLLSGFCDTLDGSLARFQHASTPLGCVLDIIMDRVVELSVVFALFLVQPEVRGLGCILILMSMLLCITSFLVVGLFQPNTSTKSFHYSPGLMERAEAFIFFIVMMYYPAYFEGLSIIFSGLMLWTAVQRLIQFSYLSDDML
jgi:archaetidylinositol phosphate synthase